MSKPIDTIRVDILPAVMRADPELGNDIVTYAMMYARSRDHFVYVSEHGSSITLEVTAAERLPIAVIDDKTLLATLNAAAMERGVGLQQLIKELAKELM